MDVSTHSAGAVEDPKNATPPTVAIAAGKIGKSNRCIIDFTGDNGALLLFMFADAGKLQIMESGRVFLVALDGSKFEVMVLRNSELFISHNGSS